MLDGDSGGQTADASHTAPTSSVCLRATATGAVSWWPPPRVSQGLAGLRCRSPTRPEVAWHRASGVQHYASHYFSWLDESTK